MNNLIFLLSAILTLGFLFTQSPQPSQDSMNPILGNFSYIEKFGEQPDIESNEKIRIETHLRYVEKLLRQKEVNHLPKQLAENRIRLLDIFKSYIDRGEFPKNFDHKDKRLPCFKDVEGTVCAVGYLVEQTAGATIVDKINSDFKYATIYEMDSKILEDWIANSGLTKKEVAMIQPAYGWDKPEYIRHEPKVNVFNFNFKTNTYNIGYEFLKKDWGVGFNFLTTGKDYGVRDSITFNTSGIPNVPAETFFDQNRIGLNLYGRYYLFKNDKRLNGFFVGPNFGLEILNKIDDGAIEKYKEQHNGDTTPYLEEGIKQLNYGLNFGYKLLIKSRFIVELGMDSNLERNAFKTLTNAGTLKAIFLR